MILGLIAEEEAMYEAIGDRLSRRKYNCGLNEKELHKLQAVAEQCRIASGDAIRIAVFEEGAQAVVNGIKNSYGLITGAESFAAFIIKDQGSYSLLKMGYYGEQFILAATAMGLGTCWLGGTFDKEAAQKIVNIAEGEKLCFITPIGDVAKKLSAKEKVIKMAVGSVSRLTMKKLVLNSEAFEKSPKWMQRAMEAAQIAPSSLNHQPWRFLIDLENERLGVTKVSNSQEEQDIGIAMAHIALVAKHYGLENFWHLEEASSNKEAIWWHGV